MAWFGLGVKTLIKPGFSAMGSTFSPSLEKKENHEAKAAAAIIIKITGNLLDII